MPQDAILEIPFPSLINPHLASALDAHVSWVRARGLARGGARIQEYLSWDLPQLPARTYPYADHDDLKMLMDFFSVLFLFDDEFDMAQGNRRAQLAEVTLEMIAIPFRLAGTPPEIVCPITLAWVEVWANLRREMSETWQNRFALNWARCLTASMEEASFAARAAAIDPDSYVKLRRRSAGVYYALDVTERSRRFEVPPHAQAHRLFRDLRDAASDVVGLMNDVQSLEREESRSNPYNLVIVLQRELRCPRADAIDRAMQMVRERLNTVLELQADIPNMCASLGLSDDECMSVEQGVEGARNWIRGNYDWGCGNGRYAISGPTETAPRLIQYEDDLLAPI
jgi:Terpene synthase family 2, C-terminal metal binding